MDEARRFLRYVTPGLLFATESAILIALILPQWAITTLSDAFGELGTVVGGVLGAGALGFVFSVLHHRWHWRWPSSPIDFRDCLRRLADEGVIADSTGKPWPKLTRAEAWVLVSVFWNERRQNELVRETDGEVKGLNDLFHAMGAARVAAVASPLTVLLLVMAIGTFSLKPRDVVRFALAATIAMGWFLAVWRNYRHIGYLTELTMSQTLTDALVQERQKAERTSPLPIQLTLFHARAARLRKSPMDRWWWSS